MPKKFITGTELVKAGYRKRYIYSTGRQSKQKEGPEARLTEKEKQKIIKQAAKHFGGFLTALGVDWGKRS